MVFQLDIESKELDRLENKKFKLASEQNKKIKELEEAIKEERTKRDFERHKVQTLRPDIHARVG